MSDRIQNAPSTHHSHLFERADIGMLVRTGSAAQLADVVTKPVLDIAGAMEAALQKSLNPVLAGWALNGREAVGSSRVRKY